MKTYADGKGMTRIQITDKYDEHTYNVKLSEEQMRLIQFMIDNDIIEREYINFHPEEVFQEI